MATGSHYELELGYEDNRFETVVSPSFHCPICLLVLKEPVMCKNQHYFCTSCIKKHLANSAFCPTCLEHLSVDTLSEAPRIVKDYLSELNIHCDYYARGCREMVKLNHLRHHVATCGFTPVQCSNEGCTADVNLRDKLGHQAEVCDFRRLKCHECSQLKHEAVKMKREILARQDQMMKTMKDEISACQNEIKSEMKEGMKRMKNVILNEVQEIVTKAVQNITVEMKVISARMKNELTEKIKDQLQVISFPPSTQQVVPRPWPGIAVIQAERRALRKGHNIATRQAVATDRALIGAEAKAVDITEKQTISTGQAVSAGRGMGTEQAVATVEQNIAVAVEQDIAVANDPEDKLKTMKSVTTRQAVKEQQEVLGEQAITIGQTMATEQAKAMQEKELQDIAAAKDPEDKVNVTRRPEAPLHLKHHQGVIVAGGRDDRFNYLSSVEMFSWAERRWKRLNPLMNGRFYTTSFLYEGQMVVAGGQVVGCKLTDGLESLNLADPSAVWKHFATNLPIKCENHGVVTYKNSLIISGGYVQETAWVLPTCSDAVHQLQLVAPYSSKLLKKLPQTRSQHGMVILDEKLFILGGHDGKKKTDGVVEYDLKKNVFKEMPPLPFPLSQMATILWGCFAILFGGDGLEETPSGTVVMYNLIKRESRLLTPMQHKRRSCTAVLISDESGDVVVIIGGVGENGKCIKSVECYDLNTQVSQDLPDMIEARAFATAVVKSV